MLRVQGSVLPRARPTHSAPLFRQPSVREQIFFVEILICTEAPVQIKDTAKGVMMILLLRSPAPPYTPCACASAAPALCETEVVGGGSAHRLGDVVGAEEEAFDDLVEVRVAAVRLEDVRYLLPLCRLCKGVVQGVVGRACVLVRFPGLERAPEQVSGSAHNKTRRKTARLPCPAETSHHGAVNVRSTICSSSVVLLHALALYQEEQQTLGWSKTGARHSEVIDDSATVSVDGFSRSTPMWCRRVPCCSKRLPSGTDA